MPASLGEWARIGDSGALPALPPSPAPMAPPSPAFGTPTPFASPSPLGSTPRSPFFRLHQRQQQGLGSAPRLRFDDKEALALRVLWEVSGRRVGGWVLRSRAWKWGEGWCHTRVTDVSGLLPSERAWRRVVEDAVQHATIFTAMLLLFLYGSMLLGVFFCSLRACFQRSPEFGGDGKLEMTISCAGWCHSAGRQPCRLSADNCPLCVCVFASISNSPL